MTMSGDLSAEATQSRRWMRLMRWTHLLLALGIAGCAAAARRHRGDRRRLRAGEPAIGAARPVAGRRLARRRGVATGSARAGDHPAERPSSSLAPRSIVCRRQCRRPTAPIPVGATAGAAASRRGGCWATRPTSIEQARDEFGVEFSPLRPARAWPRFARRSTSVLAGRWLARQPFRRVSSGGPRCHPDRRRARDGGGAGGLPERHGQSSCSCRPTERTAFVFSSGLALGRLRSLHRRRPDRNRSQRGCAARCRPRACGSPATKATPAITSNTS